MSLFNFGCLCVLLWSLASSWPHRTIPANITLAVKRLFHLLSKSILAFFWNLPREPARSPKTHFQKTYCMCLLPRKQSEVAFIPAHPFFFLAAARNMKNCTGVYRTVLSGERLPPSSPRKLSSQEDCLGLEDPTTRTNTSHLQLLQYLFSFPR